MVGFPVHGFPCPCVLNIHFATPAPPIETSHETGSHARARPLISCLLQVPLLTAKVADPHHLPPPLAIRLECASGISGTAANFLGTYKLVMEKVVNGRPCYRHIQSVGRWIAYNGDN
eukprot:2498817-Pleurochrysis_carterae.AAC.1